MSEPPAPKGERPARRGRRSGRWELFNAEAAYADSIFQTAMGDGRSAEAALRRALRAMPGYAPASFSLGTLEYQRGRRAAGQALFLSLLSLPESTPDLSEIIDEAGSFLIRRGAYADGLELYRRAAARFPRVAVFHQGVGCCAGHQGFHDEAVAASRRALRLEPANQRFVNDLGWTLFEAGRLREAAKMLARAVAMDPADALARENLRVCTEAMPAARKEKVKRGG